MSGSNVSSYKFNDSLWKSIETVLPEIEIKRNKNDRSDLAMYLYELVVLT